VVPYEVGLGMVHAKPAKTHTVAEVFEPHSAVVAGRIHEVHQTVTTRNRKERNHYQKA